MLKLRSRGRTFRGAKLKLVMKVGNDEDQKQWRRLYNEMPQIPMQIIDGEMAIAPAEKWDIKHNSENGELYPVFPFRCFGIALGTADIVENTMKHSTIDDRYHCWHQSQIDRAYCGDAEGAAYGLEKRFRIASSMCRFPLFGHEMPDSCPDFDHFGSGSIALQKMIVQEAGEKIFLLPAWPTRWDVDFKPHLAHGAVITGTVKEGILKNGIFNLNHEGRML